MVCDGCLADIVVHKPCPPDLVAEVNVFCVHEIVFAHHPNLLKNTSPDEHACSRYRVNWYRRWTGCEEGPNRPKRTARPAQLQVFGIKRLIDNRWELLYRTKL